MSGSDSAPRLRDYLRHMVVSARHVREYTFGMSREEFEHDAKTQDAVVFSIGRIGEAATQLTARFPEYAEAHPQVPWSLMKRMRNRMFHGYFAINFSVVWATIHTDLPVLESQLVDMLASLPEGGDTTAP